MTTKKQQDTQKPTADQIRPEMIQAWKEQYAAVFKYTTSDGKVAYFRQPDRKILGLSSSAPDPVAGNEIIAKNCFLGGDEIILTDDSYFYGLSKHLPTYVKACEGKSDEL